ncbi:phage holin family protein [Caproicibacterium sp. BJN0003]|uniref:phage holin family protein n=1 Tax=Caproicibacterium sp. BJN0003 TaxID=2994078 RepID=UPI002255761A|nr:phage holin family protein [Caproicibacterium sp. BJN0003]UZT82893.1 phage holin family protein [Caproicibacterium sp. BJN0003]
MDTLTKTKAVFTAVVGVLASWLGELAVPMLVLVICNLIDYVTGLAAASRRGQKISSYRGIQGISKKVCMWLLVAVGAVLDWLLVYAGDKLGMTIHLPMLIASLVAVWLICNELISILENIGDIGVPLPGFLGRLVSMLKSKVDSQVPDDASNQK